MVDSFSENDLRRTNWIGIYKPDNSPEIFYPSKYKARANAPTTEYRIVLRLAEQILISAEANAELGNLDDSRKDINKIRKRAGEELIETNSNLVTKDGLLKIIAEERRKELFTELGHRWFDLKRTDNVNSVLSSLKSNWSSTDQLYPIPLIEVQRNPVLTQNSGY